MFVYGFCNFFYHINVDTTSVLFDFILDDEDFGFHPCIARVIFKLGSRLLSVILWYLTFSNQPNPASNFWD